MDNYKFRVDFLEEANEFLKNLGRQSKRQNNLQHLESPKF